MSLVSLPASVPSLSTTLPSADTRLLLQECRRRLPCLVSRHFLWLALKRPLPSAHMTMRALLVVHAGLRAYTLVSLGTLCLQGFYCGPERPALGGAGSAAGHPYFVLLFSSIHSAGLIVSNHVTCLCVCVSASESSLPAPHAITDMHVNCKHFVPFWAVSAHAWTSPLFRVMPLQPSNH